MVLLSIITPHYNMPDTLRRLVDSVPREDWIEHIVVDDKSDTDPEKLAEVKAYVTDKGSIWIDNTTDQKGTGICRDLGIQKATGKWVLIADADDYFIKGAADILCKYLDDEADVIYFAPCSIREGNNGRSYRHVPYRRLIQHFVSDPGEACEMRLRYMYVLDLSKMIRRNMIIENDVRSSLSPVANDVMFSILCAYYAKTVKATSETVYCMTQHPGSLTTTKNVEHFRKRIEIYIEQDRFMKEHLSESDYAYTRISARTMLLQCLLDYGIKEFFATVKHLRENHAPINLLALKVRRR